jgi:hypothetical protein
VGGFAVTPEALARGGARLVADGVELEQLSDRLDSSLARSAGSLAGLATADAVGACRARWGSSLDALAASVAELGGRVLASGGRYAEDDAAVARSAATIASGGEWTPGPPGARWG